MEARAEQMEPSTTGVAVVRGSTPTRRRLATALIVGGLIAMVPAFIWLAPASHWHQWIMLVCLWALAGCAVVSDVALKQSVPVQFSPMVVVLVLVLLIGGPIPTLIAMLLPDLVGRLLFRRSRILYLGFAANVVSYGWCVLAAAAMLALTHTNSVSPPVAPSVIAVGLTLETVSFAVARGMFGTLYQGYRLGALVREEFLPLLGSEVAMLMFATACALLIAPVGIFVLVLVAPATLIPELLLPMLARSRDVTALAPAEATRLYVAALATHLGVRGRTRRVALAGAALLYDTRPIAYGVDHRLGRDAQLAAWHASERWDGGGTPAGFAGGLIPYASRLLAVAQAWADLTAADGPRIPQSEAVLALELESATRLDPAIVRAAGEIVSTEAAFAEFSTFEPKLHTLPLPRAVRTHALPHALALYRAEA
jgi:hypothetical protein